MNETNLREKGSEYGLTPTESKGASGNVVFTGTVIGTVIPSGTIFNDSNNNEYRTTANISLSQTILDISSITRVDRTVTVVCTSDHNIANNVSVTIAGLNESEYNRTTDIFVIDSNSFSYEIPPGPLPNTPGTGTGTVTFISAFTSCQSNGEGAKFNKNLGENLILSNPISGVSNNVEASFAGISGGSNQQDIENFREQVLDFVRNPQTPFNEARIIAQARTISGVTRVFVKSATPSNGQVTIFFLRDNDTSIIPNPTQVVQVKDAILLIKPATTSDASVIVNAPVAVQQDFIISGISPNTESMKQAIRNALREFFATSIQFETTVTRNAYVSSLFNLPDPQTGDRLTAYNITSPAGDISVGTGEIATLGNITFG
jgi:uncharacterized phage protein gp47/JayE